MKGAAGTCIIPDKDQIDLSDHNLTGVPSNLPQNTQYLELSFNSISTLTSEGLASLSALCIFKMTNCGLTSILPTAFQGNPRLEELDLSFNALSTIPEIQRLPKLRILDLSENLYESFTLGQSFQNLQSLSSISLGGPRISHLGKRDLKPLTSSPLPNLTDDLRNVGKLQHLTFENSWYSSSDLSQAFVHIIQSPLQTLSFRNCSYNVFPIRALSTLKELIIKKNKLESLYRVAEYTHLLTHLEILDLSFNPIKLPDHKKVNWPAHLGNLSLSGNLLGNALFDHLSPHFVSLNLTQTDITSLNTDALHHMKDLRQLSLGSNAIRDLPPDLTLPALEELHVDRNSIDTLKPETFRGLPNLKKFNGGHNPFACDCNLYWFVHDFNKTLLVDWPAAYKCYSPAQLTGTPLKDFDPGKVVCNPLIMFGICFPVVLFVLVSFGVVFHFMDGVWYVKMLWIWLRVKQRSRNKYRRLASSTFNYHAFISYSEKDAEWVQSELVHQLEAADFHLCIHERDFVPGEWVIDNIINCVESSYKTVFVLSRSFVQSEWCNYELFFAQHRAIDTQEDSLLFVLLEPIPPDLLSRKFQRLRYFLRQQTYLQWPDEEPKRRLFWSSLTAMLRTADRSVVLRQVAEDIADLCHNVTEEAEHT
ncbi:toll-like receptor 6 [Clupea harengus]|uniref:Toll-like receptor 6 n=1 Tax=Clupea harengus TaxID=7950 RepID=A0A6P8FQN0_CLUHA|nr:toll-like receptor 6 [Clupea harengus]